MKNERIVIVGGSGRGKTTFADKLALEHKLTHLCTDPQHTLPRTMNGTPDDLDYGGENGVGRWVASKWLGRDRTVIEGCHAADALKHWVNSFPGSMIDRVRTSQICDRVIWLTEQAGHMSQELPGHRRQTTHVANVMGMLRGHLDNLELWYPSNGQFYQRGL
jgi:hypothetical protein